MNDEAEQQPDKPRGDCTGCKFNYQLGTARSGEFKGQLVIRKHNSRTGPGLCEGSQRPPKGAEMDGCACGGVEPECPNRAERLDGHTEGCTEESRFGPSVCSGCPGPDEVGNAAANTYRAVMNGVVDGILKEASEFKIPASVAHCEPGNCTGCCGCSSMCTVNPWRAPEPVTYAEAAPAQDPFTAPVPAMDTENGEGEPDGARGPWVRAAFDSECDGSCGGAIMEGGEIRADGEGGWLCEDCGAVDPTMIETRTPTPAELAQATLPPHTVLAPNAQVTVVGSELVAAAVNQAMDIPVSIAPDPYDTAVQGLRDSRYIPAAQPSAFIALAAPEVADVGTVMTAAAHPDPFTAPAPMPAELPPVSGQPEPDRDRWQRYLIHGQAHTRATTFTKAGSSTFSLNEWQQRMVVLGLTQRRDLLAMAHGLDVKRDRKTLNQIAEDAKNAAGSKVAANLGTALHAFSERLDAGLMALADVPTEYRSRMDEYLLTINGAGLRTRPEWIERTTAVRADQVSALLPVAGTLDRIFQLPNGELVIGDLKTGSDLSYGWGEIATQLAVYAHGVNTHGLFDWRTKTWQDWQSDHDETLRVRTDYGIVMHLPASGEGCTLYRVDLVKGWERAQVCGRVMTMQKDKDGFAIPLTADATTYPPPLPKPGAPQRPPAERVSLGGIAGNAAAVLRAAQKVAQSDPGPEPHGTATEWDHAVAVFSAADSRERLAQLYQYAMDSGRFTDQQLGTLAAIGAERLTALQPA